MRIINYLLVFVLGFLSCMLFIFGISGNEIPTAFGLSLKNPEAPSDWIQEKQIHVYDNAIVIDVDKASLSSYASTGSMKPVLDKDSNGIRIIPKSAEQIRIGDIVSFESDDDLIVHRVIEKGEDEEGDWFITQGDNNNVSDEKIRFKDIKYVTIGVIW